MDHLAGDDWDGRLAAETIARRIEPQASRRPLPCCGETAEIGHGGAGGEGAGPPRRELQPRAASGWLPSSVWAAAGLISQLPAF